MRRLTMTLTLTCSICGHQDENSFSPGVNTEEAIRGIYYMNTAKLLGWSAFTTYAKDGRTEYDLCAKCSKNLEGLINDRSKVE